eukprot:9169016-Alexandrium_andersonii.AAC.1
MGNAPPLKLGNEAKQVMQYQCTQSVQKKVARNSRVRLARRLVGKRGGSKTPLVTIRKRTPNMRGGARMMFATQMMSQPGPKRPISYWLTEGWEALSSEEKEHHRSRLDMSKARKATVGLASDLPAATPGTPWGIGNETSPLRPELLQSFLAQTCAAAPAAERSRPLDLVARQMSNQFNTMVDDDVINGSQTVSQGVAALSVLEDDMKADQRTRALHHGFKTLLDSVALDAAEEIVGDLRALVLSIPKSEEGMRAVLFERATGSRLWLCALVGRILRQPVNATFAWLRCRAVPLAPDIDDAIAQRSCVHAPAEGDAFPAVPFHLDLDTFTHDSGETVINQCSHYQVAHVLARLGQAWHIHHLQYVDAGSTRLQVVGRTPFAQNQAPAQHAEGDGAPDDANDVFSDLAAAFDTLAQPAQRPTSGASGSGGAPPQKRSKPSAAKTDVTDVAPSKLSQLDVDATGSQGKDGGDTAVFGPDEDCYAERERDAREEADDAAHQEAARQGFKIMRVASCSCSCH